MKVTAWVADGGEQMAEACSSIEHVEMTLAHDEASLLAAMPGSEVLVMSGGHYSAAVAEALAQPGNSVRWLQFASAGFDKAKRFGVPVGIRLTNASLAFANAVAEHAMTLLLALNRRILESDRARERADWGRDSLLPMLDTVDGQTLVIVGFGAIGQATAKRAAAFGMQVVVVARTLPAVGGDISAVYPRDRLHDALKLADAVVVAIALAEETQGLIGADALAAMQPHARLINVARGPVVDEAALIQALSTGWLAGAGLDVFEQEPLPADSVLRRMPNVAITPHLGGFGGARVNVKLALLVAENVARYAHGETLMHQVDTSAMRSK